MRKIIFGLTFFFGHIILSGYSTSIETFPKTNLKESKSIANGKSIWLEIEWDYRGCHYTEDIFLNNDMTGGTGFITRKCGKNPSQTIQFTITAIHYARVASINDIHWDDPVPSDIDDSDFYAFFLDKTNEALATLD